MMRFSSIFLSLVVLLGGVVANIEDCNEVYDFIIAGAGTAGLVIANRLSELEDVSVLVIEAGDSVLNNTNSTSTDLKWLFNLGTSIDWAYKTTNQTYADNRAYTLDAGKAIGGTSTINGMDYCRAEKAQIDNWESVLGNKGWNWDNLLEYYRKSEQFQPPDARQLAAGADYDPVYHGFTGNLKVGWTDKIENRTQPEAINATYHALGIPYRRDPNGGEMRGWSFHPRTVDAEKGVREDSARAYYWPIQSRPNLKLMPNTLVNKIVWSEEDRSSRPTATGVEATTSDGTKIVLKARKEVIISTGALRSALLLELSGIGNPDILSTHKIPVKVANPAVGEYLEEQTINGPQYNGTEKTFRGEPSSVGYLTASDIFGDETAAMSSYLLASIPEYARTVSSVSNGAVNVTTLEAQFFAQHDLIFKTSTPIAEIIANSNAEIAEAFGFPYPSPFSGTSWNLLPFARGSIHIASADPTEQGLINPNYFQFSFDIKVQTAMVKYVRKLFLTEPLRSLAGTEISPGYDVVPANATDEQWEDWLKHNFSPNNHPVASTRMAPFELGGVVSERLLVHGTSNVRVIDAGVMPTQVSGHLTSTIYAMAEKAADLIKEDLKAEYSLDL